jgi:hypothetical protein
MKQSILAVLMFVASSVQATPYLRLIDPTHPIVISGAFIDPINPGQTSAGSALALVTHSTRDGCMLPTIVCEDWVPLSAGFSANGGNAWLSLGPSMNLAPLMKAMALRGVNVLTKDGDYQGLKSSLGSVPIGGPDVTISFGPAWVVSPKENWKGRFRIFAGAGWRF